MNGHHKDPQQGPICLLHCNQAFAFRLGYSSSDECRTLFSDYNHLPDNVAALLEAQAQTVSDQSASNDSLAPQMHLPLTHPPLTHPPLMHCPLTLSDRWGTTVEATVSVNPDLQPPFARAAAKRAWLPPRQRIDIRLKIRARAAPGDNEFPALLHQSLVPVLSLDKALNIQHASAAAKSLFGDRLASHSLKTLFADPDDPPWIDGLCTQLAEGRAVNFARPALCASGEQRNASWCMLPPTSLEGQILVLCSAAVAQPPLERVFSRLLAGVWGYWVVDLATGRYRCSDQWLAHLGFSLAHEPFTLGFWREMIPQTDQGPVRQAFKSWLHDKPQSMTVDHGMRGPDGTVHGVKSTWIGTEEGARGQPLRVYGLHQLQADAAPELTAPELAPLMSANQHHDLLNQQAIIRGHIKRLATLSGDATPLQPSIEAIETASAAISRLLSSKPPQARVSQARGWLSETRAADMTGARVMIVDDQPRVAEVLALILTEAGMVSRIFASPHQAIDCLRSDEVPVDLLITDWHLPGENGQRLIDAASQCRVELPVIICTGAPPELAWCPRLALLAKPFEPEELLATCQRMLSPGANRVAWQID